MDYTKLLIGVITQSYILKLKGIKRKIVHFLVMNTRKTVFRYHSDIVTIYTNPLIYFIKYPEAICLCLFTVV
jgi:hypothetical protein